MTILNEYVEGLSPEDRKKYRTEISEAKQIQKRVKEVRQELIEPQIKYDLTLGYAKMMEQNFSRILLKFQVNKRLPN
tara:strand:+ start:2316 stop:2546 length:231 start_codon:yes stop_codon:yes gene_type:complete